MAEEDKKSEAHWAELRKRLDFIAKCDVDQLVRKNREYGESWKARGGIGAFMMLARKWDRFEQQLKEHNYDILLAALKDGREEGLLDDIGDLRRYLFLIEAELMRIWQLGLADTMIKEGTTAPARVPRCLCKGFLVAKGAGPDFWLCEEHGWTGLPHALEEARKKGVTPQEVCEAIGQGMGSLAGLTILLEQRRARAAKEGAEEPGPGYVQQDRESPGERG